HALLGDASRSLELQQRSHRPEHRPRAFPAEPQLLDLSRAGLLLGSESMTTRIAAVLLCTPFLPGCGFDVPDLNRPGLDQVLANPTPEAISAAATGLVAGSRADMAQRIGYVSELGILGRESYVLTGSDDRSEEHTSELQSRGHL